MDSLTHTVLGACVGEALAGKKLGKQAMLWGAIANNIPDIDVTSSCWLSQAESLLAHRGFTHSILFMILFSLLLAYIFSRKHRNKTMMFRDWFYIFASGMSIHIFIDALTSYGTGWFEPFSHKRVSMNVLFVADPFYTIWLLISCIALLIVRRKSFTRKSWVKFGLYISTLYIGYAFINKIIIDNEFRSELKRQDIKYSGYFTTPAPLNNFLWYLVAKNDTGYWIGYHSFFDASKELHFYFRPKNANLLAGLPPERDLELLKRFSQGWYTLEHHEGRLYFSDIRFGTLGGWENPDNDFVFRYGLDKTADNDLVIQRGRMRGADKGAFTSLYKRTLGE